MKKKKKKKKALFVRNGKKMQFWYLLECAFDTSHLYYMIIIMKNNANVDSSFLLEMNMSLACYDSLHNKP